MGQNDKENKKFEIPVFEIASMEYKHAKEYNRNQQSNTQSKNKNDKKEWLTIKEINLIYSKYTCHIAVFYSRIFMFNHF